MSSLEHGEGMVRFDETIGSKDVVVMDASQPGQYPGEGTLENPYIVDWDLGEVHNPYNWTKRRKWIITAQVHIILIFCVRVTC